MSDEIPPSPPEQSDPLSESAPAADRAPREADLPSLPIPLQLRDVPHDLRLYIPYANGWEARIMDNSPREYCHFKDPEQDFFHLLLPGEIYLQYGHVKFCLNCAFRYTRITDDRLHWQRGVRQKGEPL